MRQVIGISCTVSSCWPRAWRIVSSPWSEYISKQILSNENLIVATSRPFYVLVSLLSTLVVQIMSQVYGKIVDLLMCPQSHCVTAISFLTLC
jgi:hypothetical protein